MPFDLFRSIITEQPTDQFAGDEFNQDDESTELPADQDSADEQLDGDQEVSDNDANADQEDPNKQGLVRTAAGARLVYKRKGPDGTFEELWMYNVSKIQQQMDTRREILSGTDIDPQSRESKDGKQRYDATTMGNAELLHITGLPN